jgi:hypothetical protein
MLPMDISILLSTIILINKIQILKYGTCHFVVKYKKVIKLHLQFTVLQDTNLFHTFM